MVLTRLSNAIHNHFVGRYEALYNQAIALLQQFNGEVGAGYEANTREEFVSLVMRSERSGGVPTAPDLLPEFLLPKIIRPFTESAVVKQYTAWINARTGGAA
jgi:hypothetical protein